MNNARSVDFKSLALDGTALIARNSAVIGVGIAIGALLFDVSFLFLLGYPAIFTFGVFWLSKGGAVIRSLFAILPLSFAWAYQIIRDPYARGADAYSGMFLQVVTVASLVGLTVAWVSFAIYWFIRRNRVVDPDQF